MNDDLFTAFLEDLKLRGRGPYTIKSYRDHLRQFLAWYGRDVREICQNDLKAYLAQVRNKQKLKSKSIINRFGSLSGYCDWLEEEGHIEKNLVPAFRKRYLQQYKAGTDVDERRCISVEECTRIVIAALDTRSQAIIILLAKTGMRVHELTALDVADVDMHKREIRLKPTPKRSNRLLFFDDEAARILERWLAVRASRGYGAGPLFIGLHHKRLNIRGVQRIVRAASATAQVGDAGLGTDSITPHYFRVFFTTYLLRAGMPRHYVQELRGDADGAAIDIYTRVDRDALRQSYLACVPRLGI